MVSQTGFLGRTRNPAPRGIAYVQVAFFVGIGLVMLISGFRRYDAAQPIAGGLITTGTVTTVNMGQSCGRSSCSTYWVPTIQFTAGGNDFTFAGPQSSRPVDTGDQVQVSYDPNNPASARDVSAGEGDAWVLIVLGALATLVGVVSFLLGFKRLHGMLNLTSARDASGWVGHSGLHSVRGVSVGSVVLVAFLVFFVLQLVVR